MAQDPFEAVRQVEEEHAAKEQERIAVEMAGLGERPDRFAEAKRLAHLALAKSVPGGEAFGYETGRDAQLWFSLRTALSNQFAETGVPEGEPYESAEEFRSEHFEIGQRIKAGRPAFINTFAAAQRSYRDEKQWFGTELAAGEVLPLERKHALVTLQRSIDDFIDNRAVTRDDFRDVYITGFVIDGDDHVFYELEREQKEDHMYYIVSKQDPSNMDPPPEEEKVPPLEVHTLAVYADKIMLNGKHLDDLYSDRSLSPSTLDILKMADDLDGLED